VGRRALPAILALLAAFADSRGSHGLAFDALIGAIPLTAVAALECFGAYLDDRTDGLRGIQSLLWSLALALLVLSCAARSPATQADTLPALGWSALVLALVVFGLKACVAIAPQLRRLSFAQPAKP
jgi:ABC-type uncharacterized transport system permease subunit